MNRKIAFAAMLLLVLGGVVVWHRAARDRSSAAAAAAQSDAGPVPVVVGRAVLADVPIYLNGIGTVTAYNAVSVTSRVDGQLQHLAFTEGQDVKTGDVLATLDPRPFQATLDQDLATLRKDQAQLVNAKLDLDRDVSLVKRNFASTQSVDTQKALVQQNQAQIEADQAQIDYARVQLAYCTITSPIDGRTGIRQVDPGNIVHATDTTPIVVVTEIHPISVIFTLPADDLPQIAKGQAAGALPVEALGRDNATVLSRGTLAVYDNQIDQTTGTIKLKATFQNRDSALWPGQFANIRLLVETRRGALVVPASAVQIGPSGSYVWILRPDSTVTTRPVAAGPAEAGRVVIESGLKPGDTIVVEGQYRLLDGGRVSVQDATGPA
jgi:multidrug efflux system membrane fusion protein